MEDETRAVLKSLEERLGDLRSIFSPVVPDSLAVLDGWHWQVDQNTERLLLNRGNEIDVLPIIQRGSTNERGWINFLTIIFSDPDTEMIFSMDNWTFRASPRFVNTLGGILPTSTTIYNSVYNPATPFGPLYSIVWTPAKFWPYKTQIVFKATHPRTAITPTSQIVVASVGRLIISEQRMFYESIFIESQKQTIGKVEVPIRRPR